MASSRRNGTAVSYTGNSPHMAELCKRLANNQTSKAKIQGPNGQTSPNLSMRPYLVAFIDILGFGREIQNAKSVKDLKQTYDKIRTVQKEFQHPSALGSDTDQAQINEYYGRQVIALSDAVVVVITPNCELALLMGGYDLLGLAMSELLVAQARCVEKGIFVRGGVSHGPFFFENDILLSPALARAYELESKYANYPLIVVPEETRQAIFKAPKVGSYGPGADPTPSLFEKHGKKWRGQNLYYLDYLSAARDDADIGWKKKDLEQYRAARDKHDDGRAQVIFERRFAKSTAYAFGKHKKQIIEAYRSNLNEVVRRKYRWLMKYHNSSFIHKLPYLSRHVIDMRLFPMRRAKRLK